jgi:hypothetical protein
MGEDVLNRPFELIQSCYEQIKYLFKKFIKIIKNICVEIKGFSPADHKNFTEIVDKDFIINKKDLTKRIYMKSSSRIGISLTKSSKTLKTISIDLTNPKTLRKKIESLRTHHLNARKNPKNSQNPMQRSKSTNKYTT